MKYSVLVVDDEESMRYFLTRALRKRGYQVRDVASGEEAVEAIREEPYHLVLLDLMLPGKDGIETLREIRGVRTEPRVILMTGYGTVERALEAMRHGACDFITKPFTAPQVIEKIREALSREPSRAAPLSPTAKGETAIAPPRPIVSYLIEAAQALPIAIPGGATGDLSYRDAARLFEILYFTELIRRTGGNVSLAARIAEVSRPSLHRKITEFGIEVGRYRGGA
jgi:DNA-binding NtrC family response regulator